MPADVPNDGIVSFSVEGKELDADYYRSIGYPHQMAEWLGSNIADLYAVLEAMGHKKVHDPADEIKEEEAKVEETAPEEKAESPSEPPKEQVKPELATFVLKSNKPAFKPKAENFKKKKPFKKKPQKSKSEPRQKVYTAEAQSNPEDNPFAVLQQLKSGNKE